MTSDDDQIRQSPLFKKLVADAHNMEKDLSVFNQQYRQFLERDDAAVATVLRCHLIVEHFLDRYLHAANPVIREWDQARLNFTQKLALADNPRSSIHILMPGLRCLNRIRNRVSHELQVPLEDTDLGPIRSFITVWHGAAGKSVPEGLRLVEAFALTASSWLHGYSCSIERHAPDHGLAGVFDWYDTDDSR